MQVLVEVKDQVLLSQKIIHKALAASPAALRAWESFEQGYV